MPKNTPIFGFTYPCPGEAITPAAFATLGGQIQTKMTDVNNDINFALERPNIDVYGAFSDSQVIAAGVDTVLTVTGSTYVLPYAGVWEITTTINIAVSPATSTLMRQRVRQNAVKRFAATENPAVNSPTAFSATGVMVAAAGDAVTISLFYVGTGTITVFSSISAKLFCRIA